MTNLLEQAINCDDPGPHCRDHSRHARHRVQTMWRTTAFPKDWPSDRERRCGKVAKKLGDGLFRPPHRPPPVPTRTQMLFLDSLACRLDRAPHALGGGWQFDM